MTRTKQTSMEMGIPSAEQERERRRERDRQNAHILVTEELMEQLRANDRRDSDETPPVLKIFCPAGAATWLIHSIQADNDTMFGLCDLGMGFPELGSVSLSELQDLTVNARLAINGGAAVSVPYKLERDLWFRPEHPLGVYAKAAQTAGGITELNSHLEAAALKLGRNNPRKGRDR